MVWIAVYLVLFAFGLVGLIRELKKRRRDSNGRRDENRQ